MKLTLKNEDGSADIKATKLKLTANATQVTVTPAAERSELYVAIPGMREAGFMAVAENGSSRYVFTRPNVTLETGKYYRYDVRMAPAEVKMNPLYYVTRKNISILIHTNVFATYDHQGYYFSWEEAMRDFASKDANPLTVNMGYNTYMNGKIQIEDTPCHLPIRDEWCSIIPYNTDLSPWGGRIFDADFGRAVWGYNSTTKNGVTEASFWNTISDREMHAIRFLGTPYCSAWKYERMGGDTAGDPGYIRISSTLIGQLPVDEQTVTAWYNQCFVNVPFADDESQLAQQRVFYMLGWSSNGSSSDADYDAGTEGRYWSATVDERNRKLAWMLGVSHYSYISVYSLEKTKGANVRLFLDN